MTITEFLEARIAEDEADASCSHANVCATVGSWNGMSKCDCGWPARVLRECAAKRAIVEFHRSWPVMIESAPRTTEVDAGNPLDSVTFHLTRQIAWLTQEEYRKRFGDEPPTSPMLDALASVYADHPDFDPEWA